MVGFCLVEEFCRTCGVLFEKVFVMKCGDIFGDFGLGDRTQ